MSHPATSQGKRLRCISTPLVSLLRSVPATSVKLFGDRVIDQSTGQSDHAAPGMAMSGCRAAHGVLTSIPACRDQPNQRSQGPVGQSTVMAATLFGPSAIIL